MKNPWKRNPLAVFGFSVEDARILHQYPELLAQQLKLQKKRIHLLHHPDVGGVKIEQKFDSDSLNEAENFLNSDFYRREIFREFLAEAASSPARRAELLAEQIKESRESEARTRFEVGRLQRELTELRAYKRQREEELQSSERALLPTDGDNQHRASWLASTLKYTPAASAHYAEHYAIMPAILPACVVLKPIRGIALRSFLYIDEDRVARECHWSSEDASGNPNLADLVYNWLHRRAVLVKEEERKKGEDRADAWKRGREFAVANAKRHLQAYEIMTRRFQELKTEVLVKGDRTKVQALRKKNIPRVTLDSDEQIVFFARQMLNRIVSRELKDLKSAEIDEEVLIRRFQAMGHTLNSDRSHWQKEVDEPTKFKPISGFKLSVDVLGSRLRGNLEAQSEKYAHVVGSLHPETVLTAELEDCLAKGSLDPMQLASYLPNLEPSLKAGHTLFVADSVTSRGHKNPQLNFSRAGTILAVLPLRDLLTKLHVALDASG